SVHMFQHLVYTLVAPPLMLLGIPGWMAEKLLAGWRLVVVRRLARPLVAGLIFNVVLVLSHWPVVVDATLRDAAVHLAVHTVLVVTGILMWLPIVSPHPAIKPLNYPLRMVYLFAQSVVPTVPASFITFAERPVYRFYAEVPRPWIDVVSDQQLAGAVMKIGGGLLLWGVIAGVFFRWYAVEDGGIIHDPTPSKLTWDDVQAAFDATPAPHEPEHPNPRPRPRR
ncbi:MAG TPA: cytochrome c oxidase assembly protein, partial [Acidimicrobiales bacterium]|nr:cytochrome c oxidase assembly protein [Acidimicrobiales bacterium]